MPANKCLEWRRTAALRAGSPRRPRTWLERMKLDCPHCAQSLKSRLPNVQDLFGNNNGFDCPHCGKKVKFRLHVEEIGAMLLLSLGIFLPIQYFADKLKDMSFWVVLAAFAFEAAAIMAVVAYLVRSKQRYEKPRSNS